MNREKRIYYLLMINVVPQVTRVIMIMGGITRIVTFSVFLLQS